MTNDNRTWLLISRHLAGEAFPEEKEELQHLLAQSSEKQYLFDILHAYFTDVPAAVSALPAGAPGLEERLQKIIDLSETPASTDEPPVSQPYPLVRRLRFLTRKKWLGAAAIAACLLLGWGINLLRPSALPSTSARNLRNEEVLARAGTRTKLVLPDGTQVWLNANSRLKYTSDFNTTNREVVLEGEGYFDVSKDAGKPFIVHASSLDVKVLGTIFTIKSYPQDETIEATLLKGAIEISRKDNPSAPLIILKPDEKLVFTKRAVTINRAGLSATQSTRPSTEVPNIIVNTIRKDIPDSDKVETAWLYNRLVFNGDNFQELAEKMERWYNVKIIIRDSSLNSYHFGGAFEKETVEEALDELQLTRPFSYKINQNEIELYEE